MKDYNREVENRVHVNELKLCPVCSKPESEHINSILCVKGLKNEPVRTKEVNCEHIKANK